MVTPPPAPREPDPHLPAHPDLRAGVPPRQDVPLWSRPAGDRPDVVVVAGRSLSDEALDAASDASGAAMAGAAVVAVDATASLETVVAVLGALRAGVTVVPVAEDTGPDELRHVLTDSRSELVVVGAERLEAVRVLLGAAGCGHLPVQAVDARTTWSGPSPVAIPAAPPASTSAAPPALVLYTSGTTGPPKGVPITAAAIAFDLDALAEAWDWTAGDTVVHGLPLYHVHGLVLGVLGPLRSGGRLVHTGRPTPEGYAEAVAGRGGTLCFGVPTIWGRLSRSASASAMRGARLLVSGSAPLPEPVFDAVAERCGHRLVERYGMTETLITLSGRVDGPRSAGWVGHPLPGVEARVVDETGGLVAADGESIGGLQVRGPTVMSGYLHRQPDPSMFAVGDWFVTGDVAAVAPGGEHRILGRASTDLIKTGGFRVGAGEVEAALLAHPRVREAAVVGEPDRDLGQVVVAYVVLDGDAAGLEGWVGGRLAAHKRPRRVVTVDRLPRNALGKVQKGLLSPP